jgi:hypothetical protein
MSRSTKKRYINVIDYKPEVLKVIFIKLLIVKVKHILDLQMIIKEMDMPLHRAIKDQGVEFFSFEVI